MIAENILCRRAIPTHQCDTNRALVVAFNMRAHPRKRPAKGKCSVTINYKMIADVGPPAVQMPALDFAQLGRCFLALALVRAGRPAMHNDFSKVTHVVSNT